ncbi:MAG: hypothetical protein HKN33_03940 [Pyrinomonadaceae bacterium]|nr:hypothetical protein [Pyrinomonadaceae bacterium]
MRIQIYIIIVISAFLFSVCGGSGEKPGNSNIKPSNSANSAPNTAPSPKRELENDIQEATPVPTVEAVTLKPLIEKFCAARQNKDEEALKKLYSAATLRNLMAAARAEGQNSITSYLETEPVGDKCTLVNERISGNLGEATFITKTYPNGITWKFVKENGEWKFTDQSSDFDKVKKGAK